jgi:hypothetical protein
MLALSLALPAVRRVGPALDLMFTGATLDSRVTFTRASTATYRDSTGTRQTAAINAARIDHTAAGVWLGLLIEEQRTNLLLNSATLSTQGVTVTAVAHTLSFEGTGTVTLTGTSTAGPLVGTGANNRVSLTFTPTAGTLTLTVSGSVTAAQLEVGGFWTSWIPTTGASATRAADVPLISGAAFSAFWNQTAGTIVTEWDSNRTSSAVSLSVNDASSSNRYKMWLDVVWAYSGGVQQLGWASSVAVAGTVYKDAFAYAANDCAWSRNGAAVKTDTSVTLPVAVSQMNPGYELTDANLCGHLRRIRYYPQRLANSELQALSA